MTGGYYWRKKERKKEETAWMHNLVFYWTSAVELVRIIGAPENLYNSKGVFRLCDSNVRIEKTSYFKLWIYYVHVTADYSTVNRP